jgi:hypothetical protein
MNKCIKQSLFAVTVLFLLLIVSFQLQAQTNESWKASKETVERLSKERSDVNYYEEKVPGYTLPDIMTSHDGKKVTTPQTWTKIRRGEILELFRKNVFGRVPETPYQKSFKIVNIDRNAINGAATLKQVEITITAEKKQLVIHLTLFTPNKKEKPVPAFLLIDNRGPAIRIRRGV